MPPPWLPETLTQDQKTFLLNDAVFYEILLALGVSAHDRTDYCSWEQVNHSRMGHARVLLYFFEPKPPGKGWPDDLRCEHFGFPASPLTISEAERDRFNKDLFHLSCSRLRHTTPQTKWWTSESLNKVHERVVEFILFLLSGDAAKDYDVERSQWETLLRFLRSGRELVISCLPEDKPGRPSWELRLGRRLPSRLSELTIPEVGLAARRRATTPTWTAKDFVERHLAHRLGILEAYLIREQLLRDAKDADGARNAKSAIKDGAIITCRALWALLGVIFSSVGEKSTAAPNDHAKPKPYEQQLGNPALPQGITIRSFTLAEFEALTWEGKQLWDGSEVWEHVRTVLTAANRCVAHLDDDPDHGVTEKVLEFVVRVTQEQLKARLLRDGAPFLDFGAPQSPG
jgi:hypothetical protein